VVDHVVHSPIAVVRRNDEISLGQSYISRSVCAHAWGNLKGLTWLELSESDWGADELLPQRIREPTKCVLVSTVYRLIRHGLAADKAPDVDDVSVLMLFEHCELVSRVYTRTSMEHTPRTKCCVSAIRPTTLVANIFSMLSSMRSPTGP
jgi:hypothetical protein